MAFGWSYWIISESEYGDWITSPITGGDIQSRVTDTGPFPVDQGKVDSVWGSATSGGGTLTKNAYGPVTPEPSAHASYSGSGEGYVYLSTQKQHVGLSPITPPYVSIQSMINTAFQRFVNTYGLIEGVHYSRPPPEYGLSGYVQIDNTAPLSMSSTAKLVVDSVTATAEYNSDGSVNLSPNYYFVSDQNGYTIDDNEDIEASSIDWQTSGIQLLEVTAAELFNVTTVGNSTTVTHTPVEKEGLISINSLTGSITNNSDLFPGSWAGIRVMSGAVRNQTDAPVPKPAGLNLGISTASARFNIQIQPKFLLPRWRYWGDEFPLRRLQNGVIDTLLRQLYNSPVLSIRISSRYY